MEEDINRIARPHPPPPELIQSFGTSTPISFKSRNSRSRATSKYPRDNPKILRALGRGSGNTDYFEMCFDVRASVSNVYPRSSNKRRSISAWKIRVIVYFDIDWIFDLSLALLDERKEKYFRIIVIYPLLLLGSDAFSRKQRYYGPIWANLHLLALHETWKLSFRKTRPRNWGWTSLYEHFRYPLLSWKCANNNFLPLFNFLVCPLIFDLFIM